MTEPDDGGRATFIEKLGQFTEPLHDMANLKDGKQPTQKQIDALRSACGHAAATRKALHGDKAPVTILETQKARMDAKDELARIPPNVRAQLVADGVVELLAD